MNITGTAIEITVALATTILTTALGIFGLTVSDWRQRRTQAGRLTLAIDEANRQVAFASQWVKAHEAVTSSPEAQRAAQSEALSWLASASAMVTRAKSGQATEDNPPVSLRRLFLLHPLHRRSARWLRAAFLLTLSFVPYFAASIVDGYLNPEHLELTEYAGSAIFYGDIVVLGGILIAATALRYLAVRSARSTPPAIIRRHRLRRMLLAYHFDRPAAITVRVAFYMSLAVTSFSVIGSVGSGFDDLPLLAGGTATLCIWTALLAVWAASLEAAAHQAPGTPVLAATESADAVSNTSMTTSVSR